MIITVLIFIATLLILVLFHEAGHFFSAIFFGVKVEEFGFGIPPKLFGIKSKKGILYSLNLLPFGGFVKIFGEEGESSALEHSFGSKSAQIRSLILGAGILANILLAFLVFTALGALGVPEIIPENSANGLQVSILDIAPNSPADEAGISAGDQIEKLSGSKLEIYPLKISEVQEFIANHSGELVTVLIKRNGVLFEKVLSPRKNPPDGEGAIGISLGFLELKKTPLYLAPLEGATMTWRAINMTISGFYKIISSLIAGEKEHIEVAGPVGIFKLIASAQASGLRNILFFFGILSINLAIINLLPIPGLDGGRLFFILIEIVKGKKISPKTSALFHTAGLIILIALMLLVTYQDITRLLKI